MLRGLFVADINAPSQLVSPTPPEVRGWGALPFLMSGLRRRPLATKLSTSGVSMKSTFFRLRSFLNPTTTGHTSYVLVEAESSKNGEYKWGTYMLTIADCRRRIQLEFFLGTKKARRISIAKINLLIE